MMDLLILFPVLFIGAIAGIYVKNSWREYGEGLIDGKKDLFARSSTVWYRRGYKAGLSPSSKGKIFKPFVLMEKLDKFLALFGLCRISKLPPENQDMRRLSKMLYGTERAANLLASIARQHAPEDFD